MDLSIVTKYFGFHEYPFMVSADPKFLFFSTQVREALAKCEFMARSICMAQEEAGRRLS